MPQGFCTVCWAFVPLVSQNVGKVLGGATAALFGIGAKTALRIDNMNGIRRRSRRLWPPSP